VYAGLLPEALGDTGIVAEDCIEDMQMTVTEMLVETLSVIKDVTTD
jgi:hypothetical protein